MEGLTLNAFQKLRRPLFLKLAIDTTFVMIFGFAANFRNYLLTNNDSVRMRLA